MNEHDLPLSPDDPRLTAYAFGELDEAERQVIEAAVQRDRPCKRRSATCAPSEAD
jgi:anti-sigma factor RsiW